MRLTLNRSTRRAGSPAAVGPVSPSGTCRRAGLLNVNGDQPRPEAPPAAARSADGRIGLSAGTLVMGGVQDPCDPLHAIFQARSKELLNSSSSSGCRWTVYSDALSERGSAARL